MIRRPLALLAFATLAAGCAHGPLPVQADHLRREDAPPAAPGAIPEPVARARALPPPRALPRQETFSVVVSGVPVQDLLLALARDARLNVDIHPDVRGLVTLNAIDQTLVQILDRVARQVDLRYTLDGDSLSVAPDAPFLRMYRVDYLNMQRDVTSNVSIATQVATPGTAAVGGGGAEAGNNSRTEMTNVSNNRFWPNLVSGVESLLRETDKVIPADASGTPAQAVATPATPAAAGAQPAAAPRAVYREAASVIAHPETGTLAVRATGRQHERVQEFLDRLVGSARRQVLIEATVVEVELSDDYQQGISWDLLRNGSSLFGFSQGPSGTSTALPGGTPGNGVIPSIGVLGYSRTIGKYQINAALQLLESFGRTKVLSSPKISVLNNQTALIKVVDNFVYFTLTANYQPGSDDQQSVITVTSTPNTVPVGFLMNVTPQVGDDDEVILNLRPTISRLTGFVEDPGVALTLALARQSGADVPEVSSRVPEIQTREMESIIRVRDGQTAVLGGLMRDRIENGTDQVPGVGRVPGLGELFRYRNRQSVKSELVIFLKPTIVRDASVLGDYRDAARQLPGRDFFETTETPMSEGGR